MRKLLKPARDPGAHELRPHPPAGGEAGGVQGHPL